MKRVRAASSMVFAVMPQPRPAARPLVGSSRLLRRNLRRRLFVQYAIVAFIE
jgi:hypothetical protein